MCTYVLAACIIVTLEQGTQYIIHIYMSCEDQICFNSINENWVAKVSNFELQKRGLVFHETGVN